MFHLVKQEGDDTRRSRSLGVEVGIDFQHPRAVIAIVPSTRIRAWICASKLRIPDPLNAQSPPEILAAALSPREFVIIESSPDVRHKTSVRRRPRQRLKHFEALLRAETAVPFVLSIGVALTGIEGIAISYKSASYTPCRAARTASEFPLLL